MTRLKFLRKRRLNWRLLTSSPTLLTGCFLCVLCPPSVAGLLRRTGVLSRPFGFSRAEFQLSHKRVRHMMRLFVAAMGKTEKCKLLGLTPFSLFRNRCELTVRMSKPPVRTTECKRRSASFCKKVELCNSHSQAGEHYLA